MHPSLTLSTYIGRQFLLGVAMVFLFFIAVIFLIDVVELSRRGATREAVTLAIVLEMALLKLPYMAQKIVPFAALFGGMFTFLKLTRTHELIVARAAGVSAWQFLLPALALALAIGIFIIAVFNPLVSVTVSRYEQTEAKYFKGRSSLLAVSSSGLWLREGDQNRRSVIHALRVAPDEMELDRVIIFLYDGADRFVRRIDAKTAKLEDGYWYLTDAILTTPDKPAETRPHYRLKTDLTMDRIQDSFAPPETMSFWVLPKFIGTLEAAGFSARKHRLYWHAVLAGPLLLCAMVLIAATCSLRFTRQGGTGVLVLGGLLAGFLLYFLSDVVFALGLSGSVPAVLAAWAPAVVSTLLGLAMLLHLEDG
ncbi:MAG: LPS export ABC transporter permease LptG [Alphaproteobacteria bacterium]